MSYNLIVSAVFCFGMFLFSRSVLTNIFTLCPSKFATSLYMKRQPAFLVRNGTHSKTSLYNVNDAESVVYPGIWPSEIHCWRQGRAFTLCLHTIFCWTKVSYVEKYYLWPPPAILLFNMTGIWNLPNSIKITLICDLLAKCKIRLLFCCRFHSRL